MRSGSYGMGSVIGLTGRDIHHLIDHTDLRVEITNQNADHSFVVSGIRDDMIRLMDLANEDGALHTRNLGVSIPYHSSILKEGAAHFEKQIASLVFKYPETRIISLVDQTLLTSPSIIRQEVINNLYYSLNWLRTMHVMMERGLSAFIECGPSKGLVRNATFVEGNFRFYSLASLPAGPGGPMLP
jgi:[acyl-carrier-protein] S-malonyltransferase